MIHSVEYMSIVQNESCFFRLVVLYIFSKLFSKNGFEVKSLSMHSQPIGDEIYYHKNF